MRVLVNDKDNKIPGQCKPASCDQDEKDPEHAYLAQSATQLSAGSLAYPLI